MAVFADTSVGWVPQLKKVGVIRPCTTFNDSWICVMGELECVF